VEAITGFPSTKTVLAPLVPSALTGFAPVKSNWYRNTSSSVVLGSTLADIDLPFTFKVMDVAAVITWEPGAAS
jgi:hypothetical protein